MSDLKRVSEELRTRIIQVETSGECVNDALPFLSGHCYLISDKWPRINLQYTTSIPPKDIGKHSKLNLIKDRPGWTCWDLGRDLSANRRVGRYELALKVPADTTVCCYIVPDKLVSIADAWSMIEDIEQELDRPIAWSEERQHATRSWVQEERPAVRSNTALLLDEIAVELTCAQALRRNPPLEPGLSRQQLMPVPELSLISHWAIQRERSLMDARRRMEVEHAALARRAQEHHPPERKDEIDARLRYLEATLKNTWHLYHRLLQQVRTVDLASPISLGPLVQRDSRFRRLLQAFAPRTSEIASVEPGRWSRLPPLSLNRLFECWGAIWLVKQLRQLGFVGGAEATMGAQDVAGCRFVLKRDQLQVTLDYEPHPALLDLVNLPSLDECIVSSEEWATARQFTDPERPFFGSHDRCSPDYLLRIEGTKRPILAIGDACLADPEYHNKQAKLETLLSYQRSLMWKAGTELVRCQSLGIFVIYPGPTQQWGALEASFRKENTWLLCPQARDPDQLAEQRVSRMLNYLLTTAMEG